MSDRLQIGDQPLSDTERGALARALFFADTVANSFEVTDPEVRALFQTYASEPADGDPLIDTLDRYHEDVMFDELAHDLAQRDIHEKLDHDPDVREEDYDNRDGLEKARFEEYFKEFEAHGLDRVVVNKRRYVPCDYTREDADRA